MQTNMEYKIKILMIDNPDTMSYDKYREDIIYLTKLNQIFDQTIRIMDWSQEFTLVICTTGINNDFINSISNNHKINDDYKKIRVSLVINQTERKQLLFDKLRYIKSKKYVVSNARLDSFYHVRNDTNTYFYFYYDYRISWKSFIKKLRDNICDTFFK